MLFDTHCHLTDAAFRDDLPEVLARARASGVTRLVTIASTLDDAEDALERLADGAAVWASAGVHPHEASGWTSAHADRLRRLAFDPRVVAIGECGLDYHYDHSPREVQRQVFGAQVELAAELRLPLVVHSRSAEADTLAVLRSLPGGVRGVLHCFGGSAELLEAALSLGWSISVTGVVSFRRFDGAEWLRRIPEDRLMLETDSPYMAPVPYRGKRNEPARVLEVAGAVAAHRGESLDEVSAYTTRNALRFFGLVEDA